MAEITVRFGDDKGPVKDVRKHFDYVFCTSPREYARQSHMEVVTCSISPNNFVSKRSVDIRDHTKIKNMFLRELKNRGIDPGQLGRFDIVVELDGADEAGFDAAVRLIGLLILQWADEHGTLAAFGLHLAQRRPGGGFEPPHFHVFWETNGESRNALRSFLVSELEG